MCEALFPNWSSPCAILATILLRGLLHVGLVAVAADARGRRSTIPLAMLALALASAVLATSSLSPGGLGQRAGDVDVLLQPVLLVLAGVAVGTNPSKRRVAAAVGVGLGVVFFAFVSIVTYGEAFVAP